MKEYFNKVNIDYNDAILGTPFLRKHEVVINFMNNCLKIKDDIVCNQANEYKVGEGNPQKNKKNVSMKALKQEELKIPWKDSNWLSKKSHPEGSDEEDSASCLTQKSVGLKKELSEYTHPDTPQLREEITEKYIDLLGPLPLKLPPIHEVLCESPLINESKQLKHRLPKCPEAFCSEFAWKIERHTTTGWWVPAAAKQARPMLCIPKKNGTLCTMFDLWQQNENTWKDATPFPDQDSIHHDIVRANFRSKLDMTEAYEQMHIRPEDVCKTTFSTIIGTFQSQVMQMGNCNVPSTFQQLMTAIFQEFLGRCVHIYLIFIYSQSIREHIEHIMKVLQWLRELQFYLSKSKHDLYSDKIDCLGHVIDDNGIHTGLDKMQHIREWRVPQNQNKVQKFLGLLQYLVLYMPDIMVYTTPLSGSVQNNQTFQWTPLLDKCFQSIKAIAMPSPILKSVDFNKNEPVWVIMDGSRTGISAMYDRAKAGTNVDQQDFYWRNSWAHSITTVCMNTRHYWSWKPSWNGRINFWVECLQWLLTTKVLNISRHNWTCHQGRQDGGNIFPTSIMIPSM